MAEKSIYLYVPNLIGYARIILAFAAFAVANTFPALTVVLYSASFLLDGLDGYAARKFNQATIFGALLDMITDRFATACLCMTICAQQPRWTLPLQLWVALDITSHWGFMYTSVYVGETTHKGGKAGLVRLYYTSRLVLGAVCTVNEVFFIGLYARNFYKVFGTVLMCVGAPVVLFKSYISVCQLLEACDRVAQPRPEAKSE